MFHYLGSEQYRHERPKHAFPVMILRADDFYMVRGTLKFSILHAMSFLKCWILCYKQQLVKAISLSRIYMVCTGQSLTFILPPPLEGRASHPTSLDTSFLRYLSPITSHN